MNNRLISALAGAAMLVAALLLLALRPVGFYPAIDIQAPTAGLTLSFLFKPRSSIESCEALTGNILRTTLANCPDCIVKAVRCLESIDDSQKQWFGTDPLAVPSGKMPRGVVLFLASDPRLALEACQETQRQSRTAPGRVTCFPPATERLGGDAATVEMQPAQLIRLIGGALLLLAAGTLLYHAGTGRNPNAEIGRRLTTLATHLEALPRHYKQAVIWLSDLGGIFGALWLAFSVRLDQLYWPSANHVSLIVLAPLIATPIFIRFGLYRAIVRFIGVQAVWAIIKAVVLYGVAFAVTAIILDIPDIPRSVFLLNVVFVGALIGVPRLIARDWFVRSHLAGHHANTRRKPVAVYGAGSAGVQLAMALANSREVKPVAFFDDDPQLGGRQIAGITVHPPSAVEAVIRQHDINDVLLAIPSVSRNRRQEIIKMLEPFPVRVQTLPGMADLADGKIKIGDLRDVDIEDLLGRDPVTPDPALLGRNIRGKVVLVTGAGGSIGAELCRQICALGASSLLLYENSEFNLYAIEQELLQRPDHPKLLPLLGTVLDPSRLETICNTFRVQTIFHAAAFKHVPMVEKNPAQGVLNNIFGTWHAANAAINCNVETFVLISTDKAVRPTNTMGTTKRVAEMVLQTLQARYPGQTRFTMVRFGNVLGSSGSVVPLFRKQIRDGGPITVTDPRIIRYFMTIPEAAELVIQAGAMGSGGDVFVLDMGEPVKIVDLAQRMIHLSGLTLKDHDHPEGDIEIIYSGLRPGEKLYEELLIGDNVTVTDHPRIQRANETMPSWEELQALLTDLKTASERHESERIRALLIQAVHEFNPQCGNEDLLLLR